MNLEGETEGWHTDLEKGKRSRRWAALRSSVQQGVGGWAGEARWRRLVDGGSRLQYRGRRKGWVGWLGQMAAWVEKNWAGEGGKMDQASREFGPKPIWAAWKIEKLLEFLFSSFEFETKVKIQIKYIFKFKQV
jgi:hypothetical protein